jgi:hypothetical protein
MTRDPYLDPAAVFVPISLENLPRKDGPHGKCLDCGFNSWLSERGLCAPCEIRQRCLDELQLQRQKR